MKRILFIALLFCSGALQAQPDTMDLRQFSRSLERNFYVPGGFSFEQFNENLLLRVAFHGDSIQDIRFSDGAPEPYHKVLAQVKSAVDFEALQKAFAGQYKGQWNYVIPVFFHNQNTNKGPKRNTYVTPLNYSLFEGMQLSGNMYLGNPFVLITGAVMFRSTAARQQQRQTLH